MSRTRALPPLAVALAALALAAAGCGGDDGEETTTATETERTETAANRAVTSCGLPPTDGAGFSDLLANEIDCDDAERVMQAWSTQCATSDSTEPCDVIGGFSCEVADTTGEVRSITCTSAERPAAVRFKFGS